MTHGIDDVDLKAIADQLTDSQKATIVFAHDMMRSHQGYPLFTIPFQGGKPWPEVAEFLTLKTDRLTPLGLALREYLRDAALSDLGYTASDKSEGLSS